MVIGERREKKNRFNVPLYARVAIEATVMRVMFL